MEQFILEKKAQGVSSFNGRTGHVLPQPQDYTPQSIGAETAGTLAAHEQAPSAHTHLIARTERGTPDGVAALDTSGKIASQQLPALVTSFAGRVGPVMPSAGDYTPDQVGADPVGSAATARSLHEADVYAHPAYLTRAIADTLYIAAGTPSGQAAGATWFALSGMPRVVAPNEEVTIAHSSILNAQAHPVVWLRQPGGQDVTNMSIDFDLEDAALYISQNASKTAIEGQLRLRQADPGAVFACNFEQTPDSLYGQTGSLLAGALLDDNGLQLANAAHCIWSDFPALSLNTSDFCLELTCSLNFIPGGRVGLFWQSDGGGSRSKWFFYLVDVGNGNVCLGFHTNGPGYPNYDVLTDPFPLSLAQNHHLCLQRRGQAIEAFVDGSRRTWNGGQVSFPYGSYHWPDSAAPLVLGAAGDHMNSYFQGCIRSTRLRSGSTFTLYSDAFTPPTASFLAALHDTSPAGWWIRTGSALRIDFSMVENLDSIIASVVEPELTSVRFLLSFDGGTTWQSNRGLGFTPVLPSAAQAYGMTASQLTAATTNLDVTGYVSLEVLISLASANPNVTPAVDGITIRYDERASYSPGTLGRLNSSAEFAVKHWSRTTTFRNQTGSTQTIIAYLVMRGGTAE